VHMSFARLLGGGLDWGVLQAQHYRHNGALHPSLAVYGLAVLRRRGCGRNRPKLWSSWLACWGRAAPAAGAGPRSHCTPPARD
jgi:hypothetical protein